MFGNSRHKFKKIQFLSGLHRLKTEILFIQVLLSFIMNFSLLIFVVFAALNFSADAKIFSRCEFVRKMSKTFLRRRVRTWSCIVNDLTGYNTEYQVTNDSNLRELGIFSFVEGSECTVINQN